MRLDDLPSEVIESIKLLRYDRILEKHEGPERWESVLEFYDPEIIHIDGRNILLPVGREQHPNITVLRTIVSQDERTLTLFLKDTSLTRDRDNKTPPIAQYQGEGRAS
jgi:hypothetical protein